MLIIQTPLIRKYDRNFLIKFQKTYPSDKPPKRLLGKQWTRRLHYFGVPSKLAKILSQLTQYNIL